MSGIYNIPLSCSFVDTLAQKFSKEYEQNKEVPHRLVQNKRNGALIDTITLKVSDIDKSHHGGFEQAAIQLL